MNTTSTRKLFTVLGRFCLAAVFLFTTGATKAQTVYALSGNNLITFSPSAPGTITATVPLTGIASGQVVEGMDFRPATRQLFAMGYVSSSGFAQLYAINTKSGAATAVGTGVTLVTGMTNIGFDFNPTVDRIRVTASGTQNYRLNPLTGGLAATDGALNYPTGDPRAGNAPGVVAVAYTNSYLGTGTTTMYAYDFTANNLASSSNPNAGVLNTVGSAGIAPSSGSGLDMDISYNMTTAVNSAYLVAAITGVSNFYSINLTTGATTLIGAIGSANVSEMAVYFPPTPLSKLVYGVSGTSLISFNSTTPGTVRTIGTITGITAGQTIEGLDFRPATGQLYAISYLSTSGATQLYTVDTATGAATPIGSGITLATGITNMGFDFNPVPDRIRVTGNSGQNYRLNPDNGAVAANDVNLNYASGDPRAGSAPGVVTVAYNNSFGGATATTMYAYDFTYNSLASSSNPNGGVLNTVGTLNITPAAAATVDMDISTNTTTGSNMALITVASTLYVINPVTGAAGSLGVISATNPVTDIAVYIPPAAPVRVVYAISGNNLVSFGSATPGTVTTIGAITGVTAGQTLQGLDFRPANNGLYAFGYNATSGQGQVYTISLATAAATAVGSAITLPTGMMNIGFDFNPTVDRIRLTSSTGQNYRLNPDNGTIAGTDVNLTFAATGDVNSGVAPSIAAVAYTNSFAGSTVTSLYYYDFGTDVLAATITPASPNAGIINTVGNAGIQTSTATGLDMDIFAVNGTNTAFLAATVAGSTSNFYTTNLTTGELKFVGVIGATISEMAVSTNSPLPITLLTFTGKKAGSSSELSWTTQSESNNNHFIIERSDNGSSFTAVSGRINSLAPNGNSGKSLNYNYTDISPVKGINYYRLLQVDKDGKTTVSKTVQLRFNGGYNISLYPNPAIRFINVNGNVAERSDLQIRLSDVSGKTISTTVLKGQNGNWNTQLRADNLPAGTYYVTVTKDNAIIFTEAVQKQ